MGLFNRNNKQSSNNNRKDGYNAYAAKVVCEFQAIMEREISALPYEEQKTAYDGLRAAMLKLREGNMSLIGYEQDDLMRLRAKYNDVVFAGAEIAYSVR